MRRREKNDKNAASISSIVIHVYDVHTAIIKETIIIDNKPHEKFVESEALMTH